MPETVDLYTAIRLRPEEAIKYFKAKGYTITWDWREQIVLNNAQTFTVAKAMQMDILQDIRNMLNKAQEEGTIFRDFQKELEPRLRQKGWWGKKVVDGKTVQLGSPRRLQIIYQNNMQSGFNAGRWKAFEDNKDNRPYLRYVNPNPLTAICKAMVNKIYHINHIIWRTRAPGNHYGCKSRLRALTALQAKRAGGASAPITAEPAEGWGSNPGIRRWEPKAKDYDKDIWKKGGL